MYLLQGILIGFLPVMAFAFIGTIIRKGTSSMAANMVTALIVGIIWGTIVWLARWGNASQIYGPAPLFGWLMVGVFAGGIIGAIDYDDDGEFVFTGFAPGLVTFLVMLAWVIILLFRSSDMINGTDKAKILSVTTKHIDQIDLEPADPKHIALVDQEMATVKASLALTKMKTADSAIVASRFDLGEPTKQFVDSCLWWVFPLEFKGYWQWSSTATTPGYIRVSAENDKAEAQAVQFDKQGRPINARYMTSACFHQLAERYLREHGYAYSRILDFTFEVDDNWRPYYTVTDVEWTIGFTGTKIKSAIIFDIQTGKIEECPLADVPTRFPWLDRAVPQDVLATQAEVWGKYNRVGWNWTSSNDGLRQKTTGIWYLTYDMKNCYWLTGWSSLNSKTNDLIGITLTNGQTGQTTYYSIQGFTENVAHNVALGLWNDHPKYETSEAIPYNIYGTLTYVIPMKFGGTFQGVSLVSVENKEINARGYTFDEALSNYRVSIGRAKLSNKEIPSSGAQTTKVIKGIIDNVGMPTMMGATQIFPFTIKGVKKIFQVSYSFSNPKAPFMKVGTEVVVTYQDTKETVITLETFDIPAIELSSENTNQASWTENQKVVNAETKRINNIQENQELLNPSDLSKINPDSLKQFLQRQKK